MFDIPHEVTFVMDRIAQLETRFKDRIKELEARIEGLENTPKVINNYHYMYQPPMWISNPNPHIQKYDVTCGATNAKN
jgi:hypothetical protein